MTFVSIQQAAQRAERLLEILQEVGGNPAPLEGVEAGVISLWAVLENLASPGDPNDPAVADLYVAGAGVHDLAAKVVAVWDTKPEARTVLTPHLKLLAETCYTGQNVANARWDKKGDVAREQGSADKVIELYWACLCLLSEMSVAIDDPISSSGGLNPDVIATAVDGTRWAFALKTLSEVPQSATAAKNLVRNIEKGSEQIRRASCDKGMVVVNLKNVLDHPRARAAGPFPNWPAAQWSVNAQITSILQHFYANEAVALEPLFSEASAVAPVVALLAHTTTLVHPPGRGLMFTELKTMTAVSVPTPDEPHPGTFGREAEVLATDLNHLVQVVL
jgi:hypothetical protein